MRYLNESNKTGVTIALVGLLAGGLTLAASGVASAAARKQMQGQGEAQGQGEPQGQGQGQGQMPGSEGQAPRERQMTGAAGEVSASATVEAIDKKKRTLTLRTDAGERKTVTVPEDVAAFERVKKGDKINATYQESVAVAVLKPGEKPQARVRETSEAMGGAQPGRTMERETTVTAEIVSVDPKKHTIKFRGPQGGTRMVTVKDPELQGRLGELRPGESVQLTYTEAMAVTLEPKSKQ